MAHIKKSNVAKPTPQISKRLRGQQTVMASKKRGVGGAISNTPPQRVKKGKK